MARTHLSRARTVSETVFGWLRNVQAGELAGQVAGWGKEQWEAARFALQVHGIAPLLYHTLRPNLAWSELSPLIKIYLAEQYQLNQQRVTILVAELEAILKSAHQAGIALLPLKGAVLVTHYYEDPALRPMADLDFLIQPADQGRLASLLGELGYRQILSPPRHQRYILARRSLRVASTQGEHTENPYLLEVHTEVQEEFQGSRYRLTEDLWAASEPAPWGAAPGWLVKPWALLQHLLIHASRDLMDRRARLIQLYDLSLVTPHLNGADWERLRQGAERRGEERWLYAPLRLMERYLGNLAPREVMATLAQGTPARLRHFLEHVDLYTLSYLNPFPKSLISSLIWHRPDYELLVALRHLLLPAPQDPRITSQHCHPLKAFLAYGWLKMRGNLVSWLGLPQNCRTRFLPDDHP
jgi:hypothetical protein